MYRYDEFDRRFVAERTAEFRDQVARRLTGALTEAEFKPLRLMNGLYLQLHAYMLRVAIPYGTLSGAQMRRLAEIAERWDRGYGHFTTRQNIQFNWPRLRDVPAILDALAEVEMHAIQTSGNCIRNVTSDPYAGLAPGEVEDPRITAEVIRQWSSLHPEFTFLGRKFKIAVIATPEDRAAMLLHDIGIRVVRDEAGETGYQIFVGGGQGRTPMIAEELRAFLPRDDLLAYLTAALRVYNLHGRRDNKFKARIKILVHELGIENMPIRWRPSSRRWTTPRWPHQARRSRASRPISPCRICLRARMARPSILRRPPIRPLPAGSRPTPSPTACPDMRPRRSRSSPPAGCRATPRPSRCAPSPPSPSGILPTRSA